MDRHKGFPIILDVMQSINHIQVKLMFGRLYLELIFMGLF